MRSILATVFLVFSFPAFAGYDDIDQVGSIAGYLESYARDLNTEVQEIEKKLEDLKRLLGNLNVTAHNKKIHAEKIIKRYQALERQCSQDKSR